MFLRMIKTTKIITIQFPHKLIFLDQPSIACIQIDIYDADKTSPECLRRDTSACSATVGQCLLPADWLVVVVAHYHACIQ